jgi:hypothetical protein
MSLKKSIVLGFIFYWVYEMYQHRKRMVPPLDRFRFPDF